MKMLKLSIAGLMMMASSMAQAGLWEDTKEAASSAWEATKETSSDIKESAVETWNDMTSSEEKEKSGAVSDIKKLGEKETYVKAWEGIKESAKNPENPEEDEHGILKN